MAVSKVYYANMKTSFTENLPQKLERLIKTAGIKEIDFKKKYAAIKIHFGEPGNLAYLRPNYAAVVVRVIQELGGKAFLTDCNTLYVGGRKNALDHMDAAYENGFSPFSTGCHVIIADGLKGTDDVLVPVEGGEYVKEAKIGRAVMDADIFITLNHFKGHEKLPALAERLRISAWAAVPGPVRWRCTAPENRRSTRRSASAADAV